VGRIVPGPNRRSPGARLNRQGVPAYSRGHPFPSIERDCRVRKELKEALERLLPRFSLAEFERKFRQGDLEDSIEVWNAAQNIHALK